MKMMNLEPALARAREQVQVPGVVRPRTKKNQELPVLHPRMSRSKLAHPGLVLEMVLPTTRPMLRAKVLELVVPEVVLPRIRHLKIQDRALGSIRYL